MPNASNPRITLELEPGADPIRGSIEYADGIRKPFWGWLELSAELRRAAGNEPSLATSPRSPGTGPTAEPVAAGGQQRLEKPTKERS